MHLYSALYLPVLSKILYLFILFVKLIRICSTITGLFSNTNPSFWIKYSEMDPGPSLAKSWPGFPQYAYQICIHRLSGSSMHFLAKIWLRFSVYMIQLLVFHINFQMHLPLMRLSVQMRSQAPFMFHHSFWDTFLYGLSTSHFYSFFLSVNIVVPTNRDAKYSFIHFLAGYSLCIVRSVCMITDKEYVIYIWSARQTSQKVYKVLQNLNVEFE